MPVPAAGRYTQQSTGQRQVVKAYSYAVRARICCDPTRWIDDAHRGGRVGIGTVMAWRSGVLLSRAPMHVGGMLEGTHVLEY